LDFVRAPTRIDRFLDPELSRWLTEPGARAVGLAGRTTGRAVRFVIRQIERATGRKTFHELSAFFEAFGTLASDIKERAQTARSLLHSPETAFVLVTGPDQRTLEQTDTLRGSLRELEVPLRAVIQNRTHPLPGSLDVGGAEARAERLLTDLDDGEAGAWLRRTHHEALRTAREERTLWREFERSLPEGIELATVPELERDLCSQSDLLAVAARLWS
jgi:anion-transporting  ArsA/GET3 family ATPase